MKKALFYLFVFLVIEFTVQLLVVSVCQLIWGNEAALSPWANIVMQLLLSVAVIGVFLSMGWFQASRSYLRSRPWAVLAWSVVAALGAIVPSLLLQGLLPEWTGWAEEVAEERMAQLEELMLLPGGYLVVALLPPVVEEMVFRGCVLRSLLQWRPQLTWLMIILSALFFAIMHLNPAQLPHTFLIGLLLGWMYQRTGSIVPGVAFHWANNTAAYAMFHVYHNPQSLDDIIGQGTRPLLLALLFSLCILIPALVQLNTRMKEVE